MNGNHEFDLFREMMANVAPMQQDTIEKSAGDHQPSESQLARQLSAQKMTESDLNYLSIDDATMLKPDDVVSYKRPGIQDGVLESFASENTISKRDLIYTNFLLKKLAKN